MKCAELPCLLYNPSAIAAPLWLTLKQSRASPCSILQPWLLWTWREETLNEQRTKQWPKTKSHKELLYGCFVEEAVGCQNIPYYPRVDQHTRIWMCITLIFLCDFLSFVATAALSVVNMKYMKYRAPQSSALLWFLTIRTSVKVELKQEWNCHKKNQFLFRVFINLCFS